MDKYDIAGATKPLFQFLDDASNWYVRRSRKRFWKSDNDKDKSDAYKTLHYVLVNLSIIIAPFAPFMAEELYIKLTEGKSVHLIDWPEHGSVNAGAITLMDEVKEIINEGLSIRAQNSVKVRQPLSSVKISSKLNNDSLLKIIQEELNVKDVIEDSSLKTRVEIDLNLNDELIQEGVARELIRNIQQARKEAGLIVDDRIVLQIQSDSNLLKSVLENEYMKNLIMADTLTLEIRDELKGGFSKNYKVNDFEVTIALEKL